MTANQEREAMGFTEPELEPPTDVQLVDNAARDLAEAGRLIQLAGNDRKLATHLHFVVADLIEVRDHLALKYRMTATTPQEDQDAPATQAHGRASEVAEQVDNQ